MLEPDLRLLLDAADAAGRIALKYFKSDVDIWDKGDGQGPVTQADLEIDTMLNAELLGLLREQFNYRMQASTGQLAQTHLLRTVRRNIARVKTIITEKAGK